MSIEKTFNEKLREELRISPFTLEPYNFDHYRKINPALTELMYEYLRQSGSLWRVRCGKHCKMKWSGEELLPIWWLDTPENNESRYIKYIPNDNS